MDAQQRRNIEAVRAERVAAGLQALGVEPGTTVTWQLPTRIDTVLVSLALARLGAVQNPVLHLYREREVAAVLRQSRPDFYLVPGVWRDRRTCNFMQPARTRKRPGFARVNAASLTGPRWSKRMPPEGKVYAA